MARIRINLPERFEYATEIPVRISDINFANHLGHEKILPLVHEVRVRFLNKHGYSELEIDGYGLIMAESAIVYKSEAFYGDILKIEIAANEFTKYGFDFVYKLTNKKTDEEVARAKTGFIFFNYEKRVKAEVPRKFKAIFQK